MKNFSRTFAVAAFVAVVSPAFASPFTPGNIVVNRVGDGSGALNSAAFPMFLDEYTPAGVFVQTIALPTADAGGNQMATANGSSTSEGFMKRSVDKRFLTVAGYDAPVGTAAVAGTDSTIFNRIVARIAADGSIDSSTNLVDYNGSNIRCAVSTDGSAFVTAGTSGSGLQATAGARSVAFGPGNTMTQLSADVTNTRVVDIQNGQIYLSTMSGAFRGVNTVGTGVNLGVSGQLVTLLSGFDPSTTSPQSVYDFFFATPTTLYVADDRSNTSSGGLQRWDFDSGLSTWVLSYTISAGLTGTASVRGMTCVPAANGEHVIFATSTESNANQLVMLVDTGALSSFTVLATAPALTRFRGIALAPEDASVPEVVVPNSFTTVLGRLDAGDVASLSADDDNYLRHCKFIVPNALVAPVRVRVNGTTTRTSTTGIAAACKGKMQSGGSFSLGVEQRNFVSGLNQDLATGAVGTSEVTVTSNTTGTHNEMIGTAGALQAEYLVRQTGPSVVSLWCFNADHFTWTVN